MSKVFEVLKIVLFGLIRVFWNMVSNISCVVIIPKKKKSVLCIFLKCFHFSLFGSRKYIWHKKLDIRVKSVTFLVVILIFSYLSIFWVWFKYKIRFWSIFWVRFKWKINFLMDFDLIDHFKWLLEKLRNQIKQLILESCCTEIKRLAFKAGKIMKNWSKLIKTPSISQKLIFELSIFHYWFFCNLREWFNNVTHVAHLRKMTPLNI